MNAAWLGAALALLGGPEARAAMTIATIGDSLADAIYLGLKLQPQLLKDNDIRLVRWSRARVGLTRTDYFDYSGWLSGKDRAESADFCVVEMGANDLQSIPVGKYKWAAVGSAEWRRIYTARVEAMLATLAPRCRQVMWLLQPGYERNAFLNRHNAMINRAQFDGVKSAAMAFEVVTSGADYQADGIHFNGPFSLKLAQSIVREFDSWRGFAQSCSGCHGAGNQAAWGVGHAPLKKPAAAAGAALEPAP